MGRLNLGYSGGGCKEGLGLGRCCLLGLGCGIATRTAAQKAAVRVRMVGMDLYHKGVRAERRR
jgi:hypothetical protein